MLKNKNRITPILILLTIGLFIAIMFYVRGSNNRTLYRNLYRQWEEDYVVKDGDGKTWIKAAPRTSLSEGQGYGMLISAMAGEKGWAKKEDFQRLYRFYLANRLTIDDQQTELMSWKQVDKKVYSTNATDGDLYIAESLIKAGKLWNEPKYLQQAKLLLADILRYDYNSTTQTLTVGDWANKKSKYYYLMRTSDVLPTYFDDFYQLTGNFQWLTIKKVMLTKLYQLSKQHSSGLVPDFAWISKKGVRPAKANEVAGKNDGDYSGNACRVPLFLATSKDARAKKIVTKMLRFFSKQKQVTAGYQLNGKALNNYASPSISAPIFFAVQQLKKPEFDNLFVSQQYVFTNRLTDTNYYDAALITLVAMME